MCAKMPNGRWRRLPPSSPPPHLPLTRWQAMLSRLAPSKFSLRRDEPSRTSQRGREEGEAGVAVWQVVWQVPACLPLPGLPITPLHHPLQPVFTPTAQMRWRSHIQAMAMSCFPKSTKCQSMSNSSPNPKKKNKIKVNKLPMTREERIRMSRPGSPPGLVAPVGKTSAFCLYGKAGKVRKEGMLRQTCQNRIQVQPLPSAAAAAAAALLLPSFSLSEGGREAWHGGGGRRQVWRAGHRQKKEEK